MNTILVDSPATNSQHRMPLASATGFTIRNLAVLNYSQGFTLWLYRLDGVPLADALAPGFFAAARDLLAPGDMIAISGRDGSAAMVAVGPDAAVAPLLATAAPMREAA